MGARKRKTMSTTTDQSQFEVAKTALREGLLASLIYDEQGQPSNDLSEADMMSANAIVDRACEIATECFQPFFH